jgi:hypothetical protein
MMARGGAMNTSTLDLFGLVAERRRKTEISDAPGQIPLKLIMKIFELRVCMGPCIRSTKWHRLDAIYGS